MIILYSNLTFNIYRRPKILLSATKQAANTWIIFRSIRVLNIISDDNVLFESINDIPSHRTINYKVIQIAKKKINLVLKDYIVPKVSWSKNCGPNHFIHKSLSVQANDAEWIIETNRSNPTSIKHQFSKKSITHYIKLKIFTNPFDRGSEAFPVTK